MTRQRAEASSHFDRVVKALERQLSEGQGLLDEPGMFSVHAYQGCSVVDTTQKELASQVRAHFRALGYRVQVTDHACEPWLTVSIHPKL